MGVAVGELWELRVPFKDDVTNSKKRPCLVIGVSPPGGDGIVLLVPCTGELKHAGKPGYISFPDAATYGLDKPSLVMARRVLHADPRSFGRQGYRYLGEAPEWLLVEVLSELGRMF